jgi:hypothetical protein
VKYVKWGGGNGGRRGEMYTTEIRLMQKAARRWMDEQREVRLEGQKWEP